MFGLGKRRSKFGRFLDKNGIKQERIREVSKVSKDTLTKACNEEDYKPNRSIMFALVEAVKKLTGKNVGPGDFWM